MRTFGRTLPKVLLFYEEYGNILIDTFERNNLILQEFCHLKDKGECLCHYHKQMETIHT